MPRDVVFKVSVCGMVVLSLVAYMSFTSISTGVDEANYTYLQQSRDSIVKQRKELRVFLESLGEGMHYDRMLLAGMDRVSMLQEATEADRQDCGVKPIHWRRIVQAARDRAHLPPRIYAEDPPDTAAGHAVIPQQQKASHSTATGGQETEGGDTPDTPLPAVSGHAAEQKGDKAEEEEKEKEKEAEEGSGQEGAGTEVKNKGAEGEEEKPAGRGGGGGHTEATPSPSRPEGERFLLLSSLTAGFASGVRTQLLPFLALAAATERTAVLPAASFGIPAFRTTRVDKAQGFVPLATILDLDVIKKGMPCLKTITHEEWAKVAANKVDSIFFLGRPRELGSDEEDGVVDETRPEKALVSCYGKYEASLGDEPEDDTFWQGPWDFWGETKHVITSNKMAVGGVHCGSTFIMKNGTKVLHASRGSFAHKKSVMIANFPGLVRDAFFWHSPNAQDNVRLFEDVPREICGTWKGFSQWPDLSQDWKQVANKVVKKRFGSAPFTCVHIRGEKLVINAVKAKKLQLKNVQKSNYMKKCMQGVTVLIKKAMKGKHNLFLISDLNPETGSPSAAREKTFKAWMGETGEYISERVGQGEGFCDTQAAADALKTASSAVRHSLDIYPGNCAAGEAAICQKSDVIVRFGKGSMGAFVAGQKEAEAYATCEDIFEATGISP